MILGLGVVRLDRDGCATCGDGDQVVDLNERYGGLLSPCWVCSDCAAEIDGNRAKKCLQRDDERQAEFLSLYAESVL